MHLTLGTCSVVVELGEELDQFVLILEQDVVDRLGLGGVGYKHLREGGEGGRREGRGREERRERGRERGRGREGGQERGEERREERKEGR